MIHHETRFQFFTLLHPSLSLSLSLAKTISSLLIDQYDTLKVSRASSWGRPSVLIIPTTSSYTLQPPLFLRPLPAEKQLLPPALEGFFSEEIRSPTTLLKEGSKGWMSWATNWRGWEKSSLILYLDLSRVSNLEMCRHNYGISVRFLDIFFDLTCRFKL